MERRETSQDLQPGTPYPLGPTWSPKGTNFALFSANATGVELQFFDTGDASTPSRTVRLVHHTNQIWHVFVPGVPAGQLYGYRVDGPYEPAKGHRFNPAKLLLDPYAKAITGNVSWGDEMFGYTIGSAEEDISRDDRDSAGCMPKCVVVDPAFDWKEDAHPCTPMNRTVIYETHVKGFSKLWDALPEEIRGTYAGLGSPQAIDYFKNLGITAIEVLPVHHRIDLKHLIDRGLSDYWGYNSIGFFAPDCRFSGAGCGGQQVAEFKNMVKNLHAAGLEIILDVVYNHTSEGNQLGPTLCFRGIDNSVYYRLSQEDARYYMDYTGTGNTLAVYQPNALQMVMDSLRYWILEMRVDGFRFDLAAALARELYDVNRLSSFFDVIHQDPVISQAKLIAEPWDLGQDGYLVGKFPVLWSEWNGKYRDSIRRFWKGDEGCVSELGHRLSGSADLYESTGRTPSASINFITCHDGFTLADLVSYQATHNEANGENNRDGNKNTNSWNCGAEGPTDDEAINALRRRQQRNFLVTLFLSQGVPMLTAGDESGHTQHGNNNAYCQDNEISWLNWKRDEHATHLTDFVSRLIAFRNEHPVFRRLQFFSGRPVRPTNTEDVRWLSPSGKEMTEDDWKNPGNRCLSVLLNGHQILPGGKLVRDDFFLLFLNAHHEPVTFSVPAGRDSGWQLVIDTSREEGFVGQSDEVKGKSIVTERSVMVLRTNASGNAGRSELMDSVMSRPSEDEKQKSSK